MGYHTVERVYGGDFDQLSRVVEKLAFFDLKDEYAEGTDDAEQVAVTVSTPSRSKTVRTARFDQAPIALWALVALADGMATHLHWKDPNEPKQPVITGPVPLRKVAPQYTAEARTAKLQGTVVASVTVQPDGRVAPGGMCVVHGLGLDEKAIEAVRQWIFTPATMDGRPISMATSLRVEFTP